MSAITDQEKVLHEMKKSIAGSCVHIFYGEEPEKWINLNRILQYLWISLRDAPDVASIHDQIERNSYVLQSYHNAIKDKEPVIAKRVTRLAVDFYRVFYRHAPTAKSKTPSEKAEHTLTDDDVQSILMAAGVNDQPGVIYDAGQAVLIADVKSLLQTYGLHGVLFEPNDYDVQRMWVGEASKLLATTSTALRLPPQAMGLGARLTYHLGGGDWHTDLRRGEFNAQTKCVHYRSGSSPYVVVHEYGHAVDNLAASLVSKEDQGCASHMGQPMPFPPGTTQAARDAFKAIKQLVDLTAKKISYTDAEYQGILAGRILLSLWRGYVGDDTANWSNQLFTDLLDPVKMAHLSLAYQTAISKHAALKIDLYSYTDSVYQDISPVMDDILLACGKVSVGCTSEARSQFLNAADRVHAKLALRTSPKTYMEVASALGTINAQDYFIRPTEIFARIMEMYASFDAENCTEKLPLRFDHPRALSVQTDKLMQTIFMGILPPDIRADYVAMRSEQKSMQYGDPAHTHGV